MILTVLLVAILASAHAHFVEFLVPIIDDPNDPDCLYQLQPVGHYYPVDEGCRKIMRDDDVEMFQHVSIVIWEGNTVAIKIRQSRGGKKL